MTDIRKTLIVDQKTHKAIFRFKAELELKFDQKMSINDAIIKMIKLSKQSISEE